MKNKSVHSRRFVHHAKFHCIMTTLNKLSKLNLKGGLETSSKLLLITISDVRALGKMALFVTSRRLGMNNEGASQK